MASAISSASSPTAITLSSATVTDQAKSLTLPSGAPLYVYALSTGGGLTSSGFANGEYASVTDADLNLVAAMAITTSNTNSYTSSSGYYDIGGVGVSGYQTYSASDGVNGASGATYASDSFTVGTAGSLILVIAIAGGGSCISVSLSGPNAPALTIAASDSTASGNPPAITIAYATSSSTGSLTASESTSQCSSNPSLQNPKNVGDLVGVVVFTPVSTASVTFDLPSGLYPGASGNALSLYNGANIYTVSQLPVTISGLTVGSTLQWNWYTSIDSGSTVVNEWETTSGCSQSLSSGTITVPSGGCTVTATYSQIYQVIYEVSPSGDGTVSWSGGGNTPGSTTTSYSGNFYPYEATISLGDTDTTSGYYFQFWSVSGSVTVSGSTATVHGAGTVIGTFGTPTTISLTPYPCQVIQTTGLTGCLLTIDVLGQDSLPVPNVMLSMGATGGPASFSPSDPVTGSNGEATTTVTLTESVTSCLTITVTATAPNSRYGQDQVTFCPATASVTFKLPSGLVSGASGNALYWNDATTYTVSQLPVTISGLTVGVSYQWSWYTPIYSGSTVKNLWTTTSGCSQSSSSGTITVPSGGCTVSATYTPTYQVTFAVSPSGEGTVIWSGGCNPGSSTTTSSESFYYTTSACGSTITLSYTNSASGYVFQSWSPSGGVSVSGSTVTVTGVGTITGIFAPPTTVTQPILIATPSGGTAFIYTVTGCDVSGSGTATGTSGSSATDFTASPSCTLTVTMPTAGVYARYTFASSASKTTVLTCSSGTCSSTFQPSDYYQLSNTYEMVPGSPATWDAAYTEPVEGTIAGSSGIAGCSVTLAGGGGEASCSGWFDYDTSVSLVPSFAATAGTWTAQGTHSFSDPTGGNLRSVTYDIMCSAPAISLDPAGVSGLSVNVNGAATPGSGCSISSITWNWGDGSPSTTGGFPQIHTYSTAGTYTIKATAQQSDGQTASYSESVTVSSSLCSGELWSACSAFSVSTQSFGISSLLSSFSAPGDVFTNPDLSNYPVAIYNIKPAGEYAQFEVALLYYFPGISSSIPSGYYPLEVTLVHISITSIMSDMCLISSCLTVPSTNDGTNWFLGSSQTLAGITPSLELTDLGNLNVLIVESVNTAPSTPQQAVASALNIASVIESIVKPAAKDALSDPGIALVNLVQQIGSGVEAVGGLSNVGDLTVLVLSSDLIQAGPLSSVTLLDFVQLANAKCFGVSCASDLHLVLECLEAFSLGVAIVAFAAEIIEGADLGVLLLAAASLLLNAVSFVLDFITNYLPSLPQWMQTMLGPVVGFLNDVNDPPGVTVLPSFYTLSGQLALGYNSTSDKFVSSSSFGFLLALNGTYVAYTDESLVEDLVAVGGGSSGVDYTSFLYSQSGNSSLEYTGLLQTGGTVTIAPGILSNGTLVGPSTLVPKVTIASLGDTYYTISASPFFSNGTRASASAGYVVINGTSYQMSQVSESVFNITVPMSQFVSPHFWLYLVSPGTPGGFGVFYVPYTASLTSVECGATNLQTSAFTSCTASVTGSSPTGTVSWSESGAGSVAFSSNWCNLPDSGSRQCGVTITGETPGTVVLNATYGGDSANLRSSNTAVVSVAQAPSISLDPSLGAVGISVIITGIGFLASHSLTIMYDGSTAGMPATCTTDASGNISSGCSFTVPSSALGPNTITVSDGANSHTATFTVTPLGMTCSKSTVVVGSAVTCKAKVRESGTKAPTGTVTWSSSGSGKFSRASCKLSKLRTYSICSVKYTPTTPGPIFLTASYAGDSKNPPSNGTYNLTVTTKVTKTTVSCTSESTGAGSQKTITCKAKVTGYLPTGTVNWSQSGTGSVSLSSTTCTLTSLTNPSQATCSVTMTGTTVGKVILLATYSGDLNNQGSSRTTTLTIKKAT
ncbi:MAG: beta strand repeat-containing protein [Nitrososphaerales archaeon]